ncbi:TonB-dependent hemoglobin/transferrin/lactoferrin family receptor [Psychromonas aquatilis]|uniref:TonB-dependent hemoglobin/transferrin/lactoferrin family receptor n=1 Tax=Psychromonas aquatilis TaxID=2005072 RepID=A0ABU9GSC8_9GAMM
MNKKTPIAILVSTTFALPSFAESTFTADEIVVTATRTEQKVSDVSSAIELINRETLDKNMTTNLKDTLDNTPGVEVQGDGRFGVSGVNIRGMDGSRVKILVDGIEQPTPYNPGSSQQRKYPNTIEVDTLTSIEVNKGPSSSLYGSDALGGTVLFSTKDPKDVLVTEENENRFSIKSGYSSVNEEFKNTLTWAARKDKVESIVMLTYAEGSEYKTHGDGADILGTERGAADPAETTLANGLAKVYYQANENNRFGLTFEYFDYQYDSDLASLEGYEILPGFAYTDSSVADHNKRMRIGFEHQWQLNSSFADDLTWEITYQTTESKSDNYDTTNWGFIYVDRERNRQRIASDDSIQFDIQANKFISTENVNHQLSYGVSLLHNDFSLENTDYTLSSDTVSSGSTGIPDAETIQWGIFVQDQAFLMDDKLVLSAGLRYDSFSTKPSTTEGYDVQQVDNKNDAFTARVGAVYHVAPMFSPYTQISQGFKAPTVYDLYYSYDSGAIFNGNPDLEAETSLSYEVGFRGKNENLQYNFSAFYNLYDDFITTETIGEQDGKDVITVVNLDEVKIYGAEFSSRVKGPVGTYASFNIAYVEGEDVSTGNALDTIAPLTSNIGLGYDNREYKFGGLINYKVVAKKDEWQDEDHIDAPSYNLVDITAYYKPMQDLTLRAGLFNAFDEKYWAYQDIAANDTTLDDFSTQAGRNWGVSAEYSF